MNLKNFENYIESKIRARGKSYYESGSIEEIERINQYEYSATVQGTAEYSVLIRLNQQQDIVHQTCDCPYDWGDHCKHVVAVFYHLKINKSILKTKALGTIGEIKEELDMLDKSELKSILFDLAKRNKKFRTEIRFELGLE